MYKLFLLITPLALLGCGISSETTSEKIKAVQEKQESLGQIDYRIDGDYLHEFRLKDGTRCVYQYRGGLACEWKDKQ